jgi:hypothetical protein
MCVRVYSTYSVTSVSVAAAVYTTAAIATAATTY